MKKQILTLSLVATLITSNVFTILGADYKTTKSNSIIHIDGVKVSAEPLLINGSTYVPLRNLSESAGMSVDFDKVTKTINIKTTDETPKEVPNKNDASEIKSVQKSKSDIYVNGVKLTSDAVLINGATYVPLRNLSETAGMLVDFDEVTKAIDIVTNSKSSSNTPASDDKNADIFEGYTLIEVHGGDLNGKRQANVVVDVGYGDRQYWAFTNEYGQLVKVIADEIILQDDKKEPVTKDGRYYKDEAKVLGTEDVDLDEGHVIADSLGGVSNAYNITPQNSVLNRHGDQAYMEKVIRDANGCTNFTAIITYPNALTQTPSHYSYTYTLKGKVINDEFDNVNPDEANKKINDNFNSFENTNLIKDDSDLEKISINNNENSDDANVTISQLDKDAEFIVLKNNSNFPIDLEGWQIVSVLGNQKFTFPSYKLAAGGTVKIGDSKKNKVDLHWLDGSGTWNNSKADPAELYNFSGSLVSTNPGK